MNFKYICCILWSGSTYNYIGTCMYTLVSTHDVEVLVKFGAVRPAVLHT